MPVKRTSAFSRALQEAQGTTVSPQNSSTASLANSDTAETLDSATVSPLNSSNVVPSYSSTSKTVEQQNSLTAQPLDSATVTPSHRTTALPSHRESREEQVVKTSFYPTETQLDKLDDLASEYNKRYRRKRPRINRNDIVRYLIDQCVLDTLDNLNA